MAGRAAVVALAVLSAGLLVPDRAAADHPAEWLAGGRAPLVGPFGDPGQALLPGGAARSDLPIGGPATSGLRPGQERTGAPTPGSYRGCGKAGRPEPGLQGQVPRVKQDSGDSKRGYRCNLRLIGEQGIRNRGANFQLGWYRNCAYVGLVGVRDSQEPEGPSGERSLEGIAVIDVANPRRPKLTRILLSPVGRSQHEALEVNRRRGLLVAQVGGLVARWIEVYDVSDDCTKPKFRSRYDAGSAIFHGQRVSRDGRTIYATDSFIGPSSGTVLHVIDITDSRKPTLVQTWNPATDAGLPPLGIHDLELSRDGRRAYLGTVPPSAINGTIVAGPPSALAGPSMVTLDTSEVKAGREDPALPVVGSIELPNFGHNIERGRIDGRPVLFASGETPFGNPENCPWSWGHVLDNSDERNPSELAEIKLEVNEIANCARTGQDAAVYSIHYTGVDSPRNTTALFYSYYTGGLRAFDVRDPRNPVEIAYFHPKPVPDSVLSPISPTTGDAHTPRWDSVTSDIRFRRERNELWTVAVGSGFQVLKLRECLLRNNGTVGADVLRGGATSELMRGWRGADRLLGRAGDDCIRGGKGPDVVNGGRGDDRIRGRDGRDRLFGGPGDDEISAGFGRLDAIAGGPGDDLIRSHDGRRDRIFCGPGRDVAEVDRRDRVHGCERLRSG